MSPAAVGPGNGGLKKQGRDYNRKKKKKNRAGDALRYYDIHKTGYKKNERNESSFYNLVFILSTKKKQLYLTEGNIN